MKKLTENLKMSLRETDPNNPLLEDQRKPTMGLYLDLDEAVRRQTMHKYAISWF